MSKLNQVFSAVNHLCCRKEPVFEFEDECIEEEGEEQNLSKQFSQAQKIQLIDLQDHLER